jgi:hypothetical protein
LDSRPGEATVDHLFEGAGRAAAGSVTELQVVDRGGVGADAAAVVLNVTAVSPSAPGFLTVFPCGETQPLASNINYIPGDVVPNAVVAKVGAGGKVCVFSSAETHIVIDVNAWFAESDDTVVLSGAGVVIGEAAPDGSRVVTSTSASAAPVGSLIATADEDEAYYGRVIAVDGNQIITTPVTLADIYPELSFSIATDVTAEATPQSLQTSRFSGAITQSIPLGGRLRTDCKSPLGVSTDVWVTPVLEPGRFEMDADWSLVSGVKRVRMVYAPRLALTLETTSSATLDCSLVYGLFGVNLPAIRFTVGATPPIPVVITQHLSGKVELGIHVKAGATSTVAVSTGLNLGFDYVDGKFSLVKDAFVRLASDAVLNVEGSVELAIPVTYTAKAYGLIGMEGQIKPYVGVIYKPEEGKFPSAEGGIKARLSFVMGLGLFELKHDFVETDLVRPFVIWSRLEVPTAPGPLLAQLPVHSQVRAYGGVPPYTWQGIRVPTGLSLSTNGLLTGTAPSAGSYPLEISVRDSAGQTRTRTLAMAVLAVTPEISGRFGKIVRLPDSRSWYVDLRGARHSIPDGGTYQCLTAQGKEVVNLALESELQPYVELEPAQCVRSADGNIVRHRDGDAYLLTGDSLRHIPDGGTYRCLEVNGHAVVNGVPRYWIMDQPRGSDFSWSCWNATSARGKSVRASDGTSYYIDLRGGRHWFPDGGTYDCLVAQGKADYGNVVPKEWVDDLIEYENAKCVRAEPGNIIRHSDGDAYLINSNWTRSWIKDGGSYECLRLNGHTVVNNVPRYYIDDLTKGVDITSSCWNATSARGHSVRASDGTSWYIDLRGGRHWMPDGGTYECLVAQGKSDWGYVVPIGWVDDLTQYENAKCVRAEPGDIIAHADGDSYLINPNWTRSWIKDGGIYNCLTGAGHEAVTSVPRYYIDDITAAADLTFCPADRVLRLSDGTSWYVGNDLVRHPIPNGGTYLCLTEWKGKQSVTITSAQASLFNLGSAQSCTVTEANDRVIKVGETSWYVDTVGVKHPIPNGGTYLCLTAWKGKQVMNVTEAQADAIPTGSTQSCTVTEVNNRVISVGGTTWYVDTSGVKHWIPDGGTYLCRTTWGGIPVVAVTQLQADAIPGGANDVCRVTQAANRLVRRTDGTVYYVDSSLVKHWVPNGGTYTCARSVRGIPLIDNVSVSHTDAFPEGAQYRCRAILRGPDGTSFYVDSTGQRHWIPTGDVYNCLDAKPGVDVFSYGNWNTINLFTETTWATCAYD